MELSRQEQDVEISLKQKRQDGSDLPEIMVTTKKFSYTHPDDPVNHIPEMMEKIEGKVERAPRRERRRKRKLERRMQYYEQFKEDETNKCEGNIDLDEHDDLSKVDKKETSSCSEEKALKDQCDSIQSSSLLEESKEQIIREISTPISVLTKDQILSQRIGLEEIKKMEKFQNYDVGEPNKVVL